MRAVILTVALATGFAAGCKNTPKRDMRADQVHEIVTPPPGTYTNTPDIGRDQPLLTPKSSTGMGPNTPGPNTPGTGGLPGPVNGMSTPGRR